MNLYRQGATREEIATVQTLHNLLKDGAAVRVGETAVVSTLVHTQDPQVPDVVSASVDSDAGQTFYQREEPGQIIHMDIFHSTGYVPPTTLASGLKVVLSGISYVIPETGAQTTPLPLMPYMDLQTALGGGRLDGSLSYGREEGVRKAHLTHVHVTAIFAPEIVCAIPHIVGAVENAIEGSGLQLRKIQRVEVSKGGSLGDLSDYLASSDSFLKSPRYGNGASQPSGQYRKEALARLAAAEIGSAKDAVSILEELERGLKHGEFSKLRLSTDRTGDEIRQNLTKSRLTTFDGHKYTLTEDGRLALSYLREHSQEIEAYLRRLLWSLPQRSIDGGKPRGSRAVAGYSRGRGIPLPAEPGMQLAPLSVPETIINRGPRRTFAPSDLRFAYVRERKGSPVILLIDASASMAGRRIAAAKELARHLCHTGQDKISVVAFQDAEASVVAPFTKNMSVIEQGLKKVKAAGLTPLAKGLEKALELASKSAKKPLVLCITDGIPTVPSKTLSPVDDAIAAAKALRQRGIRLGCIGLEPNRGFLREMVSQAKGTLHIVDELDASTLASIARKERDQ